MMVEPNLTDIITIHMSKLDRMRISGDFKKFTSERTLNVLIYDNIIEYLKT